MTDAIPPTARDRAPPGRASAGRWKLALTAVLGVTFALSWLAVDAGDREDARADDRRTSFPSGDSPRRSHGAQRPPRRRGERPIAVGPRSDPWRADPSMDGPRPRRSSRIRTRSS